MLDSQRRREGACIESFILFNFLLNSRLEVVFRALERLLRRQPHPGEYPCRRPLCRPDGARKKARRMPIGCAQSAGPNAAFPVLSVAINRWASFPRPSCCEQTALNALPDDEAIAPRSAAAASVLAKLGCIEVEMRSVFAFVDAPNLACFGDIPEIGPVHERSKKAWVHAVS